MKKFIFQSITFAFIFCILIVLFCFFADGYTDPFYLRFTTKKQTSLIIGTSRAAQGIKPEVLNKILGRNDIYNYSFTIGHSPYGPTYLNSIKKKINNHTKTGLFVLAVDPWSISANIAAPNDADRFEEKNYALGNTVFTNLYPNPLYLLKNYNDSFYKILLPAKRKEMFLHNDGWLEVTIPMDSAIVNKRTHDKINDYQNNLLPKQKYSSQRFAYLKMTIDFLKQHGRVYLVRLPVHPDIMKIDNLLIPDFNFKISSLARQEKIPYFDLTSLNDSLVYTDGNHLYKKSGEFVSKKIAKLIIINN